MASQKLKIKIWTDGSAVIKGDRLGGAGVYMKYSDGREKMLKKGLKNTLTGRAEIHALLLSLNALDNEPMEVDYYLDSQYVQKAMNEWLQGWVRRGWVGSAGMVKNRDLWERVLSEKTRLNKVTMRFHHVKGHQNNLEDELLEGNAIADYLANYKEQTSYEEDQVKTNNVPKTERGTFYYYAPMIHTVYVSQVRKAKTDVPLGVCEMGNENNMEIIRNLLDHVEPMGSKKCDLHSMGDKKLFTYYLHVPSKTYFVEEYGKELENSRVIGLCTHSCSSELYGCICGSHPLLVEDFYGFKLRSEIKNDLDTLPF